jgi:hypothetical protein
MTVHDYIDVLLVAAVIAVWLRTGRPALGWAVGGLLMTHVVARHIIAAYDEPLLPMGVGLTGLAVAYLLSPILTVYGRAVGSLFAVMGFMCFVSVMGGHNPQTGQGLGFNVWNALSLTLHLAAAIILVGVLRHADILARADRACRSGQSRNRL